ncbi:MAG: FtsX-like permease family protein [Chloroflexi bacterium]|nr:FtsX-like permease family protein [Chloroflexota bacterium]
MRLWFYLNYALRNLWRSRRWSAFAVFSVAAGVATMVALRSLGLSIGDSLTADARSANKGDITISTRNERIFSALTAADDNSNNFSDDMLRRLAVWTADRGGTLTGYRFNSGAQLTKVGAVTAGRPQFINAFYIDPAEYPVTGTIYAEDPAGVPLGELFTGEGSEVVIARSLADREGMQVGDTVRVSGSEQDFIVRGIVPTSAQAGLYTLFSREFLSVFFGFAYFDRDEVQGVIATNLGVNRVSIAFPDDTGEDLLLQYGDDIWHVIVSDGRRSFQVQSATVLKERLSLGADVIGRLIVVLGLGAMLLGGVGIINTMLVLVRRRTDEIAALKTFGVKGRQVAFMFLAESFWIGLFGSLVGGVAGVALSAVANRFGADFIQQPLIFRIYPEAIVFGAALGLVVSMVFGLLPVLSAAKVRPAVILRPNESANITAGCFPRLLAILFLVFVLGWIAGEILPVPISDWLPIGVDLPYQTFGIVGVAVTLLILLLLACFMWLLVWLISKIPSFGSVDLHLALRNLTTRRMRTAITLLALSAGMFALSSIAFYGESARAVLQFTMSDFLGGNVLIFPVLPQEIARPLIDARLDSLEGVESRTRLMNYGGYISEVNGSGSFDLDSSPGLAVRDTDDPAWQIDGVTRGRTITNADRGKPVAVYQVSQFAPDAESPFEVGDTVTINTFNRSERITVEIVGIAEGGSSLAFDIDSFGGALHIAPGVLSPNGADFTFTLARVSEDKLNEVLVSLSSLPLVLTFDISFFDGILTRLITQFSALPLLVGILSLGAAAVITANTVALATLERRRQIGVLRAIGLKSNRALRVLLLENVIVSLLGALLGIGLSGIGVLIVTQLSFGGQGFLIPPTAVPIAILLVFVAVAIGVFATLASGSVAVRERVMNTLRYE